METSEAFADERGARTESVLASTKTRGAPTDSDVRVVTSGGSASKCFCLAHPSEGDPNVMVSGNRALDIGREDRVLERCPPCTHRGRARDRRRDPARGHGNVGCDDRGTHGATSRGCE